MYTRIYFFRFPKSTSDKPIIYRLIKEHEVEVNILRADILPHSEGIMILEMKGTKRNVKDALSYLQELGVEIERLATRVRRDDGAGASAPRSGLAPSADAPLHDGRPCW